MFTFQLFFEQCFWEIGGVEIVGVFRVKARGVYEHGPESPNSCQ